jgi:hypothetical protein
MEACFSAPIRLPRVSYASGYAEQALHELAMREPGVSKLVSVKGEPLAAPAPAARGIQWLAVV